MPDDRARTGSQERTHIALGEDNEVRDSSKKFQVTADELKAAVEAFGNKPSDVEAHLKSQRG